MRSFFKYFSIPGILIVGCLSFCSYLAWKECRCQSLLISEALSGNSNAIAILRNYEKPWKLDARLISEALKGNVYALEVLKIVAEPVDTSNAPQLALILPSCQQE